MFAMGENSLLFFQSSNQTWKLLSHVLNLCFSFALAWISKQATAFTICLNTVTLLNASHTTCIIGARFTGLSLDIFVAITGPPKKVYDLSKMQLHLQSM